jgi:nucleoside-diphosphate-sugar epimerase
MITILGGSGFIGHHLVEKLQQMKLDFLSPRREDKLSDLKLGKVIYCVGLTADFRSQPIETVNAHVCKLLEVVRDCDFDSIVYLSSTRIYAPHLAPAREDDALLVAPLSSSDLYNISKIMGEALLFASGRHVQVARISNVYGPDFASDNFLSTIIKEALSNNKITLHTSPNSQKDYISVEDVVDGLIRIATLGNRSIYNLASGMSVSNQALVNRIRQLTGCEVEFVANAPTIKFPPINIDRMREEFGFSPSNILDDMEKLIDLYRSSGGLWNDNN